MFIKDFQLSEDVFQLDSLDLRLPYDHPEKPRVTQDRNFMHAGLAGEKEVCYYLSFLPPRQFFIIHNVRLRDSHSYFQIDYLILHPKVIFILEVKNFKGPYLINELRQFVPDSTSKKQDFFFDPINQAERQAFQLKNWLQEHRIPNFPIVPLVVLGPSTVLSQNLSSDPKSLNMVFTYTTVIPAIQSIAESHSKVIVKTDQLFKIAKLIADSNTPVRPNLLEKYSIAYSDLIKGIRCPSCGSFSISRYRGRWLCLKCHHKGKSEHISALNDYYLLVKDTITNREVRDFLRIESNEVVKYLMRKAGYELNGKNFGSYYRLRYVR